MQVGRWARCWWGPVAQAGLQVGGLAVGRDRSARREASQAPVVSPGPPFCPPEMLVVTQAFLPGTPEWESSPPTPCTLHCVWSAGGVPSSRPPVRGTSVLAVGAPLPQSPEYVASCAMRLGISLDEPAPRWGAGGPSRSGRGLGGVTTAPTPSHRWRLAWEQRWVAEGQCWLPGVASPHGESWEVVGVAGAAARPDPLVSVR